MPREQLLGLAADVDRLLSAGATAATGNENLQRRCKTLRDLGKKVAALNPVADAVDKLTQANGKAVGPAFLDLVAMTRQVRASLAGSGVTGDLQPAPASGPWTTPLSVRDLNPLHEALSHSGSGREETIRSAAERGSIGDMRLLPALLNALGDGYAPVAEMVAEKVLPKLGKAVLPALTASLELPQGKVADARRLHTICRIDSTVGADFCRRALKEGNAALRAKALELLPDLCPAEEVERTALEFVHDKSKEVRSAALAALCVGNSAAALEALCVAAVCESDLEHRAAAAALKRLSHPDTTARLLTELESQIAEATTPLPKKGKDKAASTDKAKAAADLAAERACALMVVLGERKDGDRLAVARALLTQATGKNIRLQTTALSELGAVGLVTSEVLPALVAALGHAKGVVVQSAIIGLRRLPPDVTASAFATVLAIARRPKLERGLCAEAVLFLTAHAAAHRREVEDLIRRLLHDKNAENQSVAADALNTLGTAGRALVPDLLATIRDGTMKYSLFESFARVDPDGSEVIPHIIEMLRTDDLRVKQQAIHVLRSYGQKAKAAVPALTELLESKDSYLKAMAEITLRGIER